MYFITISEKLGTNGEKIARKVAEELKYSFIGKEELEKRDSAPFVPWYYFLAFSIIPSSR